MNKLQKFISLTAIVALGSTLVHPVPYAAADVVNNREVVTLDSGATTKTGLNLYVDPSGSDSSGDGSKSKPFATLPAARDAIRALHNDLPAGGVTV